MDWYHKRPGFTIFYTALILATNLITRAIWWPEAELLSWNVPLSVFLGVVLAQPLFNLNRWIKRKHDERMAELRARHEERLNIIDKMIESSSNRNYAEAMRLMDEFLAYPGTGIKRSRSDHNPKPQDFHDNNGGL